MFKVFALRYTPCFWEIDVSNLVSGRLTETNLKSDTINMTDLEREIREDHRLTVEDAYKKVLCPLKIQFCYLCQKISNFLKFLSHSRVQIRLVLLKSCRQQYVQKSG